MQPLDLHSIFDYLSGQTIWWGLIILGVGAMVEYVVPPFPGDTVTLVGAVLVPTAQWPVVGVFLAVTLGSLVGAGLDWSVGAWVSRHQHRQTWIHRLLDRDAVRPRVDAVIERFERHGSIYLALNRFVPAFRSVFFVAAGLARISLWRVMAFGALSAALWNAGLLGAGYLVGYNLDALAGWVHQYTTAVYIGLGVGIAVWVAARLVAQRRP